MRDCGLILLAAGASVRLGQPKQLLEYQGKTLLRRAAETALASACRPVVAVLGRDAARMASELEGLSLTVVQNPDWGLGMGASLRCGLDALPPEMASVVVIVCDQPLLSVAVIDALVAAHRETGAGIVASEYGGAVGVPALLDRGFFAELASLPPTEGARSLFKRRPDQVRRIPFPGGEIDIDTVGDYMALLEAGILPQN